MKLIKTDGGYHLKCLITDIPKGINVYNKINDIECVFGFGGYGGTLSLKNCQAIDNGYNLEGLAKEHHKLQYCDSYDPNIAPYIEADYKAGFQKALEILGDEKFSVEDMKNAIFFGFNYESLTKEEMMKIYDDVKLEFNNSSNEDMQSFIQSLQQTEWDVEIETNQIPADRAPGGWDISPKLDPDGNLILKRI